MEPKRASAQCCVHSPSDTPNASRKARSTDSGDRQKILEAIPSHFPNEIREELVLSEREGAWSTGQQFAAAHDPHRK